MVVRDDGVSQVQRRLGCQGTITTRLPGERALQQEFGLAPVTIRKAVHALRDEGLVRTTPGWGTYVVKPAEREK